MPLEYRQCARLAHVIKIHIHHLWRKVGGTCRNVRWFYPKDIRLTEDNGKTDIHI